MFTIKEIKALNYLLSSREMEHPKEPENITEALSSVEEKLKKELAEITEVARTLKEKNIKIMLVTKASGKNYSIECGIADGSKLFPETEKNYDHHGEFKEKYRNPLFRQWSEINDNATIEISHIDADTWLTLLSMLNPLHQEWKYKSTLMFEHIAEMDNHGTKWFRDLKNYSIKNKLEVSENSYYFFVGIGEIAKKEGFPRVKDDPQDVTNVISRMSKYTLTEIIESGRIAIEESEKTYIKRQKASSFNKKIGFWSIDKEDSFDPSRPYEDGIDVVVVFRNHWKTISIYANPEKDYNFAGRTFAGVLFQGHPKACGSPRGQEMTEEKGVEIFEDILYSLEEGFEDQFYILKIGNEYVPKHIDMDLDTDICSTLDEAQGLITSWICEHDFEL